MRSVPRVTPHYSDSTSVWTRAQPQDSLAQLCLSHSLPAQAPQGFAFLFLSSCLCPGPGQWGKGRKGLLKVPPQILGPSVLTHALSSHTQRTHPQGQGPSCSPLASTLTSALPTVPGQCCQPL